jgi:hypothetical protein
MRENLHAVAGSVASEIHQDIDAVVANLFNKLNVGKAVGPTPTVGQVLQTLGYGVWRGNLRVTEYLYLVAIMMGKDRLQVTSQWMNSKIG